MKRMFVFAFLLISLSGFAQRKLFPVEIKGKWGYMDASGEMKLKAVYDHAADFNEGYAVVALRNLPCLIDEKGTRTIDTGLYMHIGSISEGLAAATDFQRKKFYLDASGKKVISLPDSVYDARHFSEGMACVAVHSELHEVKFNTDIATLSYRFGYIDRTGAWITGCIYEDADDFSQGVARVKVGKRFGLIDKTGRFILKPEYANIGDFNDSLAVIDKSGTYGFVNTKGEMVIRPGFEYARDFNEGLAAVVVKGKFGFINTEGKVVIEAVYDNVKPFSEGKAAVLKEQKWGFIDRTGTFVIRNVFDNAGIFSEGLCPVLVKRKWGFIDAVGRLAIPAEFDAAGAFSDGVADVVIRDLNLYVDARGNILPRLK